MQTYNTQLQEVARLNDVADHSRWTNFPTSNSVQRTNRYMQVLAFDKYDATGNTFAVIRTDTDSLNKRQFGSLAKTVCSPRSGAGSDGMIVIRDSRTADFRMDVFNADGTWAERSGNGLRCAIAHMLRNENAPKNQYRVQVSGGFVTANVIKSGQGQWVIESEIAIPSAVMNQKGKGPDHAVDVHVGNPHAVIIVKTIPKSWRETAQKLASNRKQYPEGVNVEFVRARSKSAFDIRVWERGVGETASSGTGSLAGHVALRRAGLVSAKTTAHFENEKLSVNWADEGDMARVAGPVRHVLHGEVTV